MSKERTFRDLSKDEKVMVRVVVQSGQVSQDAVARVFGLTKRSLGTLKGNYTRQGL